MEQQITWLILTVVLNGLVTGVIVVWYGKRLESRLGRQNFEHQTRFADSYTKRVAASEAIIKKYLAFDKAVDQLTGSLIEHIKSEGKSPPETLIFESKAIKTKVKELQEFYNENRLFLSPDLSQTMRGVIVNAVVIEILMSYICYSPMVDVIPDAWIRILSEIPIVPEGESVEGKDVFWLIQILGKKRKILSEFLEKVYRYETGVEF